jgi:hypothetical protein
MRFASMHLGAEYCGNVKCFNKTRLGYVRAERIFFLQLAALFLEDGLHSPG